MKDLNNEAKEVEKRAKTADEIEALLVSTLAPLFDDSRSHAGLSFRTCGWRDGHTLTLRHATVSLDEWLTAHREPYPRDLVPRQWTCSRALEANPDGLPQHSPAPAIILAYTCCLC